MRNNQPVTQREFDYPDDATLMSMTDTQSRITYANAAFVVVSGFSREEIFGQAHNMVRHPDMPKEAFADMWKTIRGGEPWSALVKKPLQDGRSLLGAGKCRAGVPQQPAGWSYVGAHQTEPLGYRSHRGAVSRPS